MFWFQHPKPFNQKAVVMQIVQRKAAAARNTRLIIIETASDAPQRAANTPHAASESEPESEKV